MSTGAPQTLISANATVVPEDMSRHLLKVMEWDAVLASFKKNYYKATSNIIFKMVMTKEFWRWERGVQRGKRGHL